MKYVDFRKFTDEHGAMPVYLFEGEEVYFHEKGEALLRSRFVTDTTLDYATFEGGALKGEKIKDLLDAVSAFPFLSEKRLVKVTEFYPSEKDFERYLKDFLENAPKDGILLIMNVGKGKAGTAALSKAKGVTFVDCGKSDEETIKKWIYLTAKKAGVYVDGMTSGLLAAYCGYDMARVSKETEKLLFCCEAEELTRITDEMVETHVAPASEYKNYELTNAVSRKNYGEFVKIMQEFTVKSADFLAVLSMLASHFRTLYEVGMSKGSDKEVAAQLGMKEFAVKKSREQAAKFTGEQLFALYSRLYDAVSKVKCGELTPPSALKTVTAGIFFENL
ncbi:MAG: DNA polymerase III subunit delta [Clostridia bacterium]|nr:DNA polymerase III subunit delta [Clostridia bacterium]